MLVSQIQALSAGGKYRGCALDGASAIKIFVIWHIYPPNEEPITLRMDGAYRETPESCCHFHSTSKAAAENRGNPHREASTSAGGMQVGDTPPAPESTLSELATKQAFLLCRD